MILDSITLQNVGVFKGSQTLSLAEPSASRPVTTVLALNGSGKTTLLEALRLGLYGRRSPSLNNGHGYESYLRESTHRNTPAGEPSAVEISFRLRAEGRWTNYRVRRQWEAKESSVSEQLEVHIDGEISPALTGSWAEVIEQWLPARLSSFCFFDGEQVAALADPEQSKQVLADAMRALLGLDVVDQLKSDLKILDRRRRESSLDTDQASSVSPLNDAVNQAELHVQSLLHSRGSLANQVERARLAMEDAERAMEAGGGTPMQQRDRLAARLSASQELCGLENAALLEHAYGLAPLLLVRTQLARFKEHDALVGSTRSAEALQSRDAWVIERLRSVTTDAKVINGMALALEKERQDRVDAMSDSAAPSQVLEVAGQLPLLESALAQSLARSASASESLMVIEREIDQLPAEADASAPHNVWRRTVVDHSQKVQALNTADQNLAQARGARDEALAAYQHALEANVRSAHSQRDTSLLNDRSAVVQKSLERFRQAILVRHAKKLSSLIGDCFAQLHRKTGFVSQVQVDPETLALSLLASDGRMIDAGKLSAGERQLLAVATIWAILRASGRPLPLVVDTPLGRLDSIHRQSLVERFFVRAAHQVVLLATDTELDTDVTARLMPKTSISYEISYLPEERRSEIRQVKDPHMDDAA